MAARKPYSRANGRQTRRRRGAVAKGQTYGTILNDLERHQTIDLLPDREAETLAEWMQERPGAQIITRDRGKNYIEWIALGAPKAIQVAERFHLLHNSHDTLRRMFEKCTRELRQAEKQIAEAITEVKTGSQDVNDIEVEKKSVTQGSPEVANQSTPYRELRFAKVKELQNQDLTRREIAKRVHLDRRTVSKYFKLDSLPNIIRSKKSILKTYPYMPYLTDRWNEGRRDRKQL